MRRRTGPWLLSDRKGRWVLNLYPPFLFNRIRVEAIEDGFRYCRVRVIRSPLTRNLNGTTFGGSIYSAADPMYAVMYWQQFARRGEKIQVWLRSASVRYVHPAATHVTLEFRLSAGDVDSVVEELDRDGRVTRTHRAQAIDRAGKVCAVIDTEVYVRRPRGSETEVSAF